MGDSNVLKDTYDLVGYVDRLREEMLSDRKAMMGVHQETVREGFQTVIQTIYDAELENRQIMLKYEATNILEKSKIEMNYYVDSFKNGLSALTDSFEKSVWEQVKLNIKTRAEIKKNEIKMATTVGNSERQMNLKAMNAHREFEIFEKNIQKRGNSAVVSDGAVQASGERQLQLDAEIADRKNRQGIETKTNEYLTEYLNTSQELAEIGIDGVEKFKESMVDFASKVYESTKKLDQAMTGIAMTFGYSGQNLATFKDAMKNANVKLAEMNVSMQDFAGFQSKVTDATGRNILITGEEGANMAGLDYMTGEKGGAANLVGQMAYFNTSVEDSMDMLKNGYTQVNKLGLSSKKYFKDVEKSLKLAQKYNFKGGVEGAQKMAMWAQNTKFNLDNLENSLEKFGSNDISSVIENAAKLNVLGGNFAMYGDPLGMMYEANNDPAAFAKRQANMLKGKGTFNKKTGETDFNEVDLRELRVFAESMGMSVEDAKNMIRQTNRHEQVSKVINSHGLGGMLDEEQMSAMSNKATWNQKRGEWTVKVAEKGANGETNYVEKSIDEVAANPELLDQIAPDEKIDEITTYVKDLRDAVTKMEAAQATVNATADKVYYEESLAAVDSAAKSLEKAANDLSDPNSKLRKLLDKEVPEAYTQFAKVSGSIFQNITKDMPGSVQGFKDALDNSAEVIGQEMTKMVQGIQGSMKAVGITFRKSADDFYKSAHALVSYIENDETLSKYYNNSVSLGGILGESGTEKGNKQYEFADGTNGFTDFKNIIGSILGIKHRNWLQRKWNSWFGGSVDDGYISPGVQHLITPVSDNGFGKSVLTHKDDHVVAQKASPSKGFFGDGNNNGISGGIDMKHSGNINLNVNGSNTNINLVELMNDPIVQRELANIVIETIKRGKTGGYGNGNVVEYYG